ncbi:MAG: alpha/beta fold hydrolase [Planctomycetes bacterium]|nr:alpha/beta fold hydrolase [Planctomycetota bacterium]
MKNTEHADGLFLRELQPSSRPKGAFLLLHGMESHSGWFVDLATRLVADGYAVVAYDRHGWGKSRGPRGRLSSYRQFVESAVSIASDTRRKYHRLHLAGMSWGGMAALYLALRRGWLFDSVTLLSPGMYTKANLPFMDKVTVARSVVAKNPDVMVTPVFKPEHFTASEKWRQFIQDDPDRVRQVSTGFCFETMKMRRFIQETAGRRLIPPTLCLLAGKDRIVENEPTADLAGRAGAMVEVIPDAAHTLLFEAPEQTAVNLRRHAAGAVETAGKQVGRAWVVGAGAVGGTIASLLSFAGVKTGVLVKPEYKPLLAEKGFRLTSGSATRTTDANTVWADRVEDLPTDPHLVVAALKSFDTVKGFAPLIGHIPQTTVITSLQNGIGNEDALGAMFPEHTIVAGSICASLELAEPGKGLWPDDRGGLAGARHRGDPDIARTVWMNLLSRTGMECQWVHGGKASQRLKWSKLMLNIGFNALNSITGLSSADLLRHPEYGSLSVQALREGFALMRRLRLEPVDLPGFPVSKMRYLLMFPDRLVKQIMAWQAGRAPEASFSMRQDILKKRQHTEIQEINGKIVEIGKHFGVATPANEKLVAMLEKID